MELTPFNIINLKSDNANFSRILVSTATPSFLAFTSATIGSSRTSRSTGAAWLVLVEFDFFKCGLLFYKIYPVKKCLTQIIDYVVSISHVAVLRISRNQLVKRYIMLKSLMS
jgi:hypothetical protein